MITRNRIFIDLFLSSFPSVVWIINYGDVDLIEISLERKKIKNNVTRFFIGRLNVITIIQY